MENPEDFLTILRHNLKYEIAYKRIEPPKGKPCCPVCKEPFLYVDPSMHEVFVTRGETKGWSDRWKAEIYVPQNVVLVHEPVCHLKAQHEFEYKVLCAMQLIRYCGYASISTWMDTIDSMFSIVDRNRRMILEEAEKRWRKDSVCQC